MIVDPDGNEIKKKLSKEEVVKRLEKLRPKNAEEHKLLVKKIAESLEFNRKKKMNKGIDSGFDGVFKENADRRLQTDGYSKDRDLRMIAQIPKEMDYVAREIYGEDYYKDPKILKKLLVDDEVGRMCLTVDPKTI